MDSICRSVDVSHERTFREEDGWLIIRAPASSLKEDAHKSIVWFAETEYKNRKGQFKFWRGRSEIPMLYDHGFDPIRRRRPIGVIANPQIIGDGRSASTRLDVDYKFDSKDEFAKEIYGQYERKVFTDFSVHMPIDTVTISGKEANTFLEMNGREEKDLDVFLWPEFMEISAGITWGSNPDSSIAKSLAGVRQILDKEYVSNEKLNEILTRLDALEQGTERRSRPTRGRGFGAVLRKDR